MPPSSLAGVLRGAGQHLDTAVFCGVLLLLLLVPLPFGSHRTWAVHGFAFAVFALWSLWCVSLALANRPPSHLERGVLSVVLIWFLWLAWIYAQTLHWPASWIAVGSPHRLDQVQNVAHYLGTPVPRDVTPSLDASLSRRQALLSAAYGTLFMLIVVGLRERSRFRWLLWVLIVSGIAQAMYGSVMVLSGLEYGAWGAKEAYRGFATGTFVNRNHFAGYLEICIAAAVGLIVASPLQRVDRRGWRQHLRYWLDLAQDRRVFARAAIGVFFIALILSQSRMGNVAAVGGICAGSLALLLSRRRHGKFGALILVGSILVIDIWLFGRWFGIEQLAERYATAPTDAGDRLALLADVRRMIPPYGWLGSGLGTFMLAYPEFRSPTIPGFVDHAHNDYAQFLIETGVVGVGLLAAMVLATAVRALLILRRRNDALAQGIAAAALTAISALAIHSTADFNLQIPANAATLIALMAAVWACSTRSSRDRKLSGSTGAHRAERAAARS